MNACKYCGKPLTLTPEYDTCIECQGRIMREATMPQNSFGNNSAKTATKVITHKEARKNVQECYGMVKTNMTREQVWDYEHKNIETQIYINQQEKNEERAKKVEELLELYREKDKLRDELFNEYTSIYSTAQSLNKIVNDFKQIQEQINILEKELEEMK